MAFKPFQLAPVFTLHIPATGELLEGWSRSIILRTSRLAYSTCLTHSHLHTLRTPRDCHTRAAMGDGVLESFAGPLSTGPISNLGTISILSRIKASLL